MAWADGASDWVPGKRQCGAWNIFTVAAGTGPGRPGGGKALSSSWEVGCAARTPWVTSTDVVYESISA